MSSASSNHPLTPGETIKRLRKRYGPGKALSILAGRLGRATYFMLKNQRPFDIERFLAN